MSLLVEKFPSLLDGPGIDGRSIADPSANTRTSMLPSKSREPSTEKEKEQEPERESSPEPSRSGGDEPW